MSKQPKPFLKTKPQRSENSLFGLELPRKYRPFLIILIILLALAGTWLASQQKMRSLQKRFSAGTPVPAQSAPDSIGNNATPSPAEAPARKLLPWNPTSLNRVLPITIFMKRSSSITSRISTKRWRIS